MGYRSAFTLASGVRDTTHGEDQRGDGFRNINCSAEVILKSKS